MPVILKPEPKFGLSKFSIDRRAKADDQGKWQQWLCQRAQIEFGGS
jgi:hypothetical protein